MTVDELLFFSLDNDDFQLTLYEIANGRMNFNADRLTSLSFNPFSVNAKHKLTLSRDIDPDTNLFHDLNDIPCDYYSRKNVKQNPVCLLYIWMFIVLVVIKISLVLINDGFQFDVIGISESWLKDSDHLIDLEGYNFIHRHRNNRIGGVIGLYQLS